MKEFAASDSRLSYVDVVTPMCGEGVADGPWTAARRERLLHSRLTPTRALVEALGRFRLAPPVVEGRQGDDGDEP